MIEAGKSFCPYCVRAHKEAFYSASDITWGVELGRKLSGKYEVRKKIFPGKNAPNGRIILEDDMKENENGLPNSIQVTWSEGEKGQEKTQEKRLFRCCPICAEKHNTFRRVNSVLGRYPTYVVALIGDMDAGKSVFVDAIATTGNTQAVNSVGYAHKLHYTTPAVVETQSESTPPESRGQSKVLTILDRQDNDRVVAVVYFVDVAGELWNGTKKEKQRGKLEKELVWNLLDRNSDYPGADAYIFVEPAVKKHDSNYSYSAEEIYRDLSNEGLLKNRPLAYVMSHADMLIGSGKFKQVEVPGVGPCQIMTKDTFDLKQPTSYAREKLLSRVALEDAIVRSYQPAVLNESVVKCFLVCSCDVRSEKKEVDGVEKERKIDDLTGSRHVMDPLIWILNKLKLFPLKERAD